MKTEEEIQQKKEERRKKKEERRLSDGRFCYLGQFGEFQL